jgi:ADP-heptose:LPS heptosyltransferase
MRKLLLQCGLPAGDLVMLSAAVRDLHRCYPGKFLTDLRSPCPELWDNSPYRARLSDKDPEVELIKCDTPLINRANKAPYHYVHGFIHFLNEQLGLKIEPSEFRGDIHLSGLEKSWHSQVRELADQDLPFWIVSAGGKFDVTIKWWDSSRYQKVIDHFRGKMVFVQVGRGEHFHPKLDGVIDLRGKTNLRELIRLVYHSQGVLCGVTCLMHLAAAVETKAGRPPHRPCVVVAGGREPVHWEAYPYHQFIHTLGALDCCKDGGCWKDRTYPLLDGSEQDSKRNLCLQVRGKLPRCMDMITPEEVIRRIELYFMGGALQYLDAPQWRAAEQAIDRSRCKSIDEEPLTQKTARSASEKALLKLPTYPGNFAGRGIVICGGGVTYFPALWVCINILRRLGCELPIQVWHLGKSEFSPAMEKLLVPFDVECVDASLVREKHPARTLGGWELKPFSILHCGFKEVLLLDADNMPVRNPEYLFESREFQDTGAVFWPDIPRREPPKKVWELCGIKYRRDRNFESGQILVDKEKTWRALCLTMWYNEHSDFFYRQVYGDKETFHLAFRKTGTPYAMPSRGVQQLTGTMCQHDFQGRRLFQHRNTDVWNLFLLNRRVPGFRFEKEARKCIETLKADWDGDLSRFPRGLFKPRRSAPLHASVKIGVWMISCKGRDAVRQQTLERLSKTDWTNGTVHIQMDDELVSRKKERMTQAYHQALVAACESQSDYILIFEDDLIFNRYLSHNLQHWEPLRSGYLDFGSLYNPQLRATACSVAGQFRLVDSRTVYGSQAFIFSREFVNYLLAHWEDRHTLMDIRISRLAADLSKPAFYHMPSLVQHAPGKSTWGGSFHQARDFDPDWKSAARVFSTKPSHKTRLYERSDPR